MCWKIVAFVVISALYMIIKCILALSVLNLFVLKTLKRNRNKTHFSAQKITSPYSHLEGEVTSPWQKS